MDSSQYTIKAKAIIEGASGKSLSVEERREAAIDLAALMLNEARRTQTNYERSIQTQLDRMMNDPNGKAFTTGLTDQCFRSHSATRVADQMIYLLSKFGIPHFLPYSKQLELLGFKLLGKSLCSVLVPLAKRMLRRETTRVILPGENRKLAKHMSQRRKEGVRINLNHLGETILGEGEAEKRLQIYLNDLAKPEVEYISVKISTICSQLNLLAWEETLEILTDRLKQLYRAAMHYTFVRANGKRVPKFVNLDMEEYRDLHLTVELFQKVLDDPEFFQHSAGIVLQSYLPDSHLLQQELTVWAMKRVAAGGAPIKIRIVKGANLAMEQVEASMRCWPQAPYTTKADVDANYKRMVNYACISDHAKAAYIGIASHNLFDIAYALLLRTENGVERYVEFEMLEGMADHICRLVQALSGGMLLYCPSATEKEFHNAVAYLVRRLDENTAPENFLRHLFGLIPNTWEWQNQANQFSLSCHAANAISLSPRRNQNRHLKIEKADPTASFENDPDTDWSLTHNRKWAEGIINDWSQRTIDPIPLVIGGKEIPPGETKGIGRDPSKPEDELYQYTLADASHVDKALQTAEKAQKKWSETPVEQRSLLLAECAHMFRCHRGDLIGAMIADGGKSIIEADVEISEAIDFIEYYRRSMEELSTLEDIQWKPKGTVFVTSPWNFPCSIATGGISGALAAGNCVIYKPPSDTVLVGWELVKLLWKAGVSKEVLQFITGKGEVIGSQLVKDPRVSTVVLTGSTETAKLMLKMRPGLDLAAETGGKNAIIVTSLADRDLAVNDIIQSAFGHAGQKCSACSLAISEAEIYDDLHFREQLSDAAASLKVGSQWDLSTRHNPLIHAPNNTLMQGLTKLEKGERWLLEPKQDPDNPNLWSPGIKLGVLPGSFTYENELFGPVLALMRADNLEHAIKLANGTKYGLTSGIQTLDDREQEYWIKHIEAGNCYINRGITGAIVRRQPFGGTKESSFGLGAKAGGPNYVPQLLQAEQIDHPKDQKSVSGTINVLTLHMEKSRYSQEQMDLWNASVGSYAFWWSDYFTKDHDPSLVLGQDNILRYVPHKKIVLRVQRDDDAFDLMRVIAACVTCGTSLELSGSPEKLQFISSTEWLKPTPHIEVLEEIDAQFIERVERSEIKRVRLLSDPPEKVSKALAEAACNLILSPVLANGRIELFKYLREVSLSIDYHRYGNLGIRENEKRAPVK